MLGHRRIETTVSIHASVKDATLENLKTDHKNIQSFNPRICKRCDGAASSVGVKYNVSIHASVKDAT